MISRFPIRSAMFAVVAAFGLASVANVAVAANSQNTRMKTCNADATAKSLKGADRKAFMKTCLSNKDAAPAAAAAAPAAPAKAETHPMTQQEKMKACNAEAKTKAPKGAEHKAFMSTCLKSAA